MIKLHFFLWLLGTITISLPLPFDSFPVNWTNKNIKLNLQDAIDKVPYYILEEDSGREKRGDGEVEEQLEGVTFEAPTILKLSVSTPQEALVDLTGWQHSKQDQDKEIMRSLLTGDRSASVGLPIRTPLSKKPITLTIVIDNILQPGKADRYIITNCSQIVGSGAVLKVNFTLDPDKSCSPDACGDLPDKNLDKIIEFKPKKVVNGELTKIDEEEENQDEDLSEQKALQDVLRKILSFDDKSVNGVPTHIGNFYQSQENHMEPSAVQMLSPKLKTSSNQRAVMPKNPEYGHLCKLVDQLSSHLPRSKLVSLLTSLVSRMTSDGHAQ